MAKTKKKDLEKDFSNLLEMSRKVHTLRGISALLEWDKETYMPPGAALARAEQLELVASLIYQEQTSPRYAKALSKLIDIQTGNICDKSLPAQQKAALREWREDYVRLKALPQSFVEEFARLTGEASHVWVEARENDSFTRFAPYLDKIVQLCRKKAELLGYEDHPYDALLDCFEPGMRTKTLDPLFKKLRKPLTKLVQDISTARQIDNSFLFGRFSHKKQLDFSHKLLADMGYPKEFGRLDFSAHPFSTAMHATDSRVTTRIHHSGLLSNILSTLHEGGHSLYELGLPRDFWGSPLGEAVSMGIHESQSRWWECLIGLSKPFWKHFLPPLKQQFPKQLEGVPLNRFYRAINKVEADLIRVEADEVTYCLHVMLRYELERDMIAGTLAVRDLPEAWNEKMQNYLGIIPPNNSNGCLQDVHWSIGAIGYFPSYALGNLYSAQFFEAFTKEHPNWEKRLEKGELLFIKTWLNEKIHLHGRTYPAEDLVKRVSGKSLSATPYINYLNNKYSEVYKLG